MQNNNKLILRDPLKMLGDNAAESIEKGGFAAILARAGVGKTALLVQLALHSMVSGKNVLHISTDEPVDKVNLWYQEVFNRLTQSANAPQGDKLWDQLLYRRFIMTFETETFNLDKVQKRISELISNGIFKPQVIMIDGFAFNETSRPQLHGLKDLAKTSDMTFWFTVRTHRDEPISPLGLAESFMPFTDLFELILSLYPDKDRVYLKRLCLAPGDNEEKQPELYLDPATLLVSNAFAEA
jgi:hypothetical protein